MAEYYTVMAQTISFRCWSIQKYLAAGCGAALGLAIAAQAMGEARNFIDNSGRVLRGELVRVDGDWVIIQREDGQKFTLKAADFSPSDRSFFAAHATGSAAVTEEDIPELNVLKKQTEETIANSVKAPYEAGMADLNAKYLPALDRAQATSQQAGRLEDTLLFRKEKELITSGKGLPPRDEPGIPATLKQLRDFYRTAAGRVEMERIGRLKQVRDNYVRSLSGLVATLTKAGRLDAAQLVKKLYDGAANGSGGVPEPALNGAVGTPVAGPGAAAVGGGSLSGASKDHPFINTLGMRFVPVPGTQILMCIHETRRQDYAAYANEAPSVNGEWKNQKLGNVPAGAEDNHPVVGVNWADATAFCAWLSKKEGHTYRLPTDREWSEAVGIGSREKKDATPGSLTERIKGEYPWGSKWPPSQAVANLADSTLLDQVTPKPSGSIPGYTDGFATTAPVMSFKPNHLGIYDLSGNAWEWCQDWFSKPNEDRVSRGGSFRSFQQGTLLSSERDHTPGDRRSPDLGFRCVVELGSK